MGLSVLTKIEAERKVFLKLKTITCDFVSAGARFKDICFQMQRHTAVEPQRRRGDNLLKSLF